MPAGAPMGLTSRYYIAEDGGALKRVPQRVCDALPFGKDAIPEYAGTRQRVVQVLVENEERRPVRILDARGSFWTFDADGKIDEGLHATIGDLAVTMRHKPKDAGKVVDLVPDIKKREFEQRHRWTVTTELLDMIAADLWPGIHGPAPDVTTVKGKEPKRPSLSYKAKNALGEIDGKLESIVFELATLNEHSLKGLVFEAARNASYEKPELLAGVVEAAKKQLAIRAAYRTGKGEWIAVVETFVSSERDPIITTKGPEAHERCATQAEAIEASKRLLAEAAKWIGPDTHVEVSICSALEWQRDEE